MTSILKTNAIEPEGGTTNLVIGESGQNTVISNNDIRANVLQDSGGNAIFTSNGSGVMSGVNSGLGTAMVLISSQTSSSIASMTFNSGIDSTYGHYIFKFYHVRPLTNGRRLLFQVNATDDPDGGYDTSLFTSTSVNVGHAEHSVTGEFNYYTDGHLAQDTGSPGAGGQTLVYNNGNAADKSISGTMHLFNPSSTVYAKHFYARMLACRSDNYTLDLYTAGYINDTTAIDDIKFYFSSGNIDGTIKMWGVK